MFHPIERTRSILELTQIVLNQVRATIQYSNTHCSGETYTISSEQDRQLNTMRAIPIPHEDYSLAWIQSVARVAGEYQVGNCCEQSCLAFMYLIEHSLLFNTYIELFNHPFLDHVFVVVNRNPETDESNPLSWNKDTIICDPWAGRQCYEIKDSSTSYIMSTVLTPEDTPKLYRTVYIEHHDSREAHLQACFVLRHRWHQGQSTVFNAHVPMCYEVWDLEESMDTPRHESSL